MEHKKDSTTCEPLTPKQVAALPNDDLARRVARFWLEEQQPSDEWIAGLASALAAEEVPPLRLAMVVALVQQRVVGTVLISPPMPAIDSSDGKTTYPAMPDYRVSVERVAGWMQGRDGEQMSLMDYPQIGASPTLFRALVVALVYLDSCGLWSHGVSVSNRPDASALIGWGEHQWATDGFNIFRADVTARETSPHRDWRYEITALQLEKVTMGERIELSGPVFSATAATFTTKTGDPLSVPCWIAYRFRGCAWRLIVNGSRRLAEVLNSDGEPVAYVMPAAGVQS